MVQKNTHYDKFGKKLKVGQTAVRLHVVGGHIEDEIVKILKINNQSIRIAWTRDGKKGTSTLYNIRDLVITQEPDKKKTKIKFKEVKNRFELMDLG